MNAAALFGTGVAVGLMAGATSCAAVQGGLVAGTVDHACRRTAGGLRAVAAFGADFQPPP